MLRCRLAVCSDPVDLVRFGAIEAMAGALASPTSSSLTAGGKAASAREDTVQRQRRARAWRLMVTQAGVEVSGVERRGWCGATAGVMREGVHPSAAALALA